METTHEHNFDANALRHQLNESRIEDFVTSLVNRDDLDSQRYNLVSLVSKGLEELLATERQLTMDFLQDSGDGYCPACLIMHTRDVTQLENVVDIFNSYVTNGNECDGDPE